MRAAILSVGTELTVGRVQDTNSRFLAAELTGAGVDVVEARTVGDDLGQIAQAMGALAAVADWVLVTGGLGPTADDLTREALARWTARPLVVDGRALAHLEAFYRDRDRPMPPINRKQAMRPRGARLIANPHGTAPGVMLRLPGGPVVVLMPGPPREMQPMFRERVLPAVRRASGRVIHSRSLRLVGIGESDIETRIADLMGSDPSVAPYAGLAEVELRVATSDPDARRARSRVDARVAAIRERVGQWIYGEEDDTLEAVIHRLLLLRRETVSVAESLSAGRLATRLTRVAGSSETFAAGIVAYATRTKETLLGVDPDLLRREGSVHPEVAVAMARAAKARTGTSWALATTGVAGPTPGDARRPVGTVYLGLVGPGGEVVREAHLFGDRDAIADRSAQAALVLLWQCLTGRDPDVPTLPSASPTGRP